MISGKPEAGDRGMSDNRGEARMFGQVSREQPLRMAYKKYRKVKIK